LENQIIIIDSTELARRWAVPESWIRNQVRPRVPDPIPHVRLGKYVRFEWGGAELKEWWGKHRSRKVEPVRQVVMYHASAERRTHG
jgi:hypothetical protein